MSSKYVQSIENIKSKTLICPLICRWKRDDSGRFFPQLVGGERRYRAIDYLYNKNELVADPSEFKLNKDGKWKREYIPAQEAYNKIVCQIHMADDDLEALELSWAENKNRIDLTDGHEVAEVIRLRKHGADDDRILKILQRDEKWLCQTDSLIQSLDEDTLNDLVESKINRASALELLSIDDLDLRSKVREKANEVALENSLKKQKAIDPKINKAINRIEEAEVKLYDSESSGDFESVEEIKIELDSAKEDFKKAVDKKDSIKPIVKPKQVKQAVEEITGESNVPKVLSSKKIQTCIDYLDSVIDNSGECKLYKYTVDVSYLQLVKDILQNNVMSNDEEIGLTIMDHFAE